MRRKFVACIELRPEPPGEEHQAMTTSEETLDACMSMIEAAARAGERCPTGEQIAARMRSLGMSDSVDGAVPQLARAGKLRIEVGHRNWRVVKILAGPAKGLNTASATAFLKARTQ
jgi:hypothetical protein